MIVGEYYDGDNDNAAAWRQHDVYHQALQILISTANRLTRFAKGVLEDQEPNNWGSIESCDHRTLQMAHDLLAAAWRFRCLEPQGELCFNGISLEVKWLSWLRDETIGWLDEPSMVRAIQIILTEQNTKRGYEAESELCRNIMSRFPDVPWRPVWQEACEAEPVATKSLAAPMVPAGISAPIQLPCECADQGLKPCNRIPCETTATRALREGWGPID